MEKPRAAGSTPPSPPRTPPPSTTYVRADAAAFKDLVQRLTAGPANSSQLLQQAPPPSSSASPGSRPSAAHKGFGLKRLNEQRRGTRRRFTALRPMALSLPTSPRVGGAPLSPLLFSPSTSFADLRLLDERVDVFDIELNEAEEEKAIKERRFYLHPSPRSRSRIIEPELLTLFPLTSPNAGKQQP